MDIIQGNQVSVKITYSFTGGNVLTYRGHSIEVHSVEWSPDGRRIASLWVRCPAVHERGHVMRGWMITGAGGSKGNRHGGRHDSG